MKPSRRWILVAACLAALPAAAAEPGGPADIAAVELEDLLDLPVAAASLRTEHSSDAAASVFVLTAEDFRAAGARTLSEALTLVPGLFSYRDDYVSQAGFRGVGLLADYTTRVLVLLDGHPLNNALGYTESYIDRDLPVPLDAVLRIEVIKGPVGGVYGPTAFLGVVNVVTAEAGPVATELTAFGAAGQGQGLGGGAAVVAGGALGRLKVAGALEAYGSGGYDWTYGELVGSTDRPAPPGGLVAGMDAAAAGAAYLRLALGDARLSAGCGATRHGIPSAPYGADLLDDRNEITIRNCFVDVGTTWATSARTTLSARLAYDDYLAHDTFVYPAPPEGDGLSRDHATDRWLSGELRLTARLGAATVLTGGLRGEAHTTVQRFWDDAGTEVRVDKDFATAGAYLVAEQRLSDRVALHAALTASWHQLFGGQVTPRLAAVLTPGPADVVKVIWSRGFRTPTAGEAFYQDGTEFLANPDVRSESADAFELLWERRLSARTALTLSGFANHFTDLIGYVTVPAPGDPASERLQAWNAGSFWTTGLEASLNARLGDSWRALGGLSWQRSSAARDNFPAVTGNLLLRWRTPWRPLSLAAGGTFVGERDKPDGAGTVGAQGLVLARAALEVPGVRGLTAELGVTNLLDAVAPSPVTSEYEPITELPSAPRTFSLLLRWRRE